jgi:hypothetical protein
MSENAHGCAQDQPDAIELVKEFSYGYVSERAITIEAPAHTGMAQDRRSTFRCSAGDAFLHVRFRQDAARMAS